MAMPRNGLVPLAGLTVTLLWPCYGRCDESPRARADALFHEGRDAMRAGDVPAACAKFAESEGLDPAKGTLLNLAFCEESAGNLVAARSHLTELLATEGLDENRRSLALAHQRQIDERLASTAQVRPTPPPDQTPPESATPYPAAARPVLVGAPRTTRAKAPAPRDSENASAQNSALYLLGGLGLVSLGTGAVAGILVIDKAHTVDAHCENKRCDDVGLEAAASGRTLSTISTITVGAGLVMTLTATYFLLFRHHSEGSHVSVGAAPGGARLSYAGAF